jgi:hypothetical protein
MKPSRWVVVVGLVGIAGMGASCTNQSSNEDAELRYYLGEHGRMYVWEVYVKEHLCQLEKASTIPDAEKRCTTQPPSITPPPAYPPK